MTMEEQQPLLGGHASASSHDHHGQDLESGHGHGDEDERRNAEEDEEKRVSWREWAAEKLESKTVHKTVITLIVIDASCVLADLVYTFLSSSCPSPSLSPSEPSEEQPQWLEVLSHISLTITTTFLVEIPLNIWAFGPSFYMPLSKKYAMSSLHLFDALVIVTTFVLEAVLRGKEQELVGLLILFRLWRLVKLVGGIAVGAGEVNEELSQQLTEVEQQLTERTDELTRSQGENAELRRRLAAAGIDDYVRS